MFPLSLAGCTRLKSRAQIYRLQLLFVRQPTARPFQIPAPAPLKRHRYESETMRTGCLKKKTLTSRLRSLFLRRPINSPCVLSPADKGKRRQPGGVLWQFKEPPSWEGGDRINGPQTGLEEPPPPLLLDPSYSSGLITKHQKAWQSCRMLPAIQ